MKSSLQSNLTIKITTALVSFTKLTARSKAERFEEALTFLLVAVELLFHIKATVSSPFSGSTPFLFPSAPFIGSL